ncbi:MAG: ArsR family transcriptional regulator [Thaumarchaeota archaeon]|nr:ArsR family transcriptional regulator [Nitrososphaerota archaeon]
MLEVQSDEDREIQCLLSDKANRIILESIMTTAKSTSQICTECNIPTSTAYRKVQKLSDYKIIRKIGTINESGKREILYKGNFAVLKKALS